jgi:hypothetical protein
VVLSVVSPPWGVVSVREQTMTYEQFKAKWTKKLGSFVLVAILNDLVKVGILRRI